jgi:hypothetical protein
MLDRWLTEVSVMVAGGHVYGVLLPIYVALLGGERSRLPIWGSTRSSARTSRSR